MVKYSIVAPVLNEGEVLKEFYRRLTATMDRLKESYEIVFVNDGSTDDSLDIMEELHSGDRRVKIIDLSRNFGHQLALTAGIGYASGKAVITIDVDLQDPPEVIPELIKKWKEGYQVVYGVRKRREGDNFFKKTGASIFYRLLYAMADVRIPRDAGDFRLLDRKVVDILKKMRERDRYIRGLTFWIGFDQVGVPYERKGRFAGHTKYSLTRLMKLAVDAVVSFSTFPLRIAAYFGFIIAAACFIYTIYVVILEIFKHVTPKGWSSLIMAILFLGGVQLVCLGAIGEYIGRMGEEIRRRPLFVVKRIIDGEKQEERPSIR
jgi:dolichol-phosphate mannosyltransferase